MSEGLSITDQLEPYEWDSRAVAAYEAAIEAINGAVGAYSALISAEEAKSAPDATVVAAARAEQTRLTREREALRPDDTDQIANARRQYSMLARTVRESR
ncbi:hypothetical protein [Streptomyces sp. ITFR-16]|uniref:hypothetical protein n=1 Tax=Streptomyces sp. ITFR-16 TaxID=3075198 RepID=UPI00288901F5|nr:hypothetical protein [Streptomyces sp. ITFR-16]WNI20422.1 hypothetical protein RLT58_00105 [Streptomyces sp. ITFR-16]